jgi:hypothetical protein
MMYGVSMSRDGTSTVISQRLETPDAPRGGDDAGDGRALSIAVPEPDAVG